MYKLTYLSSKTGMSYEVVTKDNYLELLNHLAVLLKLDSITNAQLEIL